MSRRRWVIAGIAANAALLFGALPASAAIVEGRSVGSVRVGQNEPAVRDALGKPTKRSCYLERPETREAVRICFLTYSERKMEIHLVAGRVAHVGTRSRSEKTRKGIGPGARKTAVARAYSKCEDAIGYCLLGRTSRTGDRYTYIDFDDRGRVERVAVGRWDVRHECALGCG